MDGKQIVCLQIHNDYQITGGETKTAFLIADLLERNGIKVIRYYKTNMEYATDRSILGKIKNGMRALNNPQTSRDINEILDKENVDFALVHNVVSVISNSAYHTLIKRGIPIIKYLQNYNLFCLNGAQDHGEYCVKCRNNKLIGVRLKCYKESAVYSFIKYLIKKDMDKRILPNISAFMPNSEFVMNKHIEQGFDSGKMNVMYNYVDISQIPYEGERDYYLFFGRLSKEKGVLTTINAFKKIQDKKLIIMGSGILEEEVKSTINESNNIEFIGSREGIELLEYVAKAKAVIVPSEWDEPLPRTILEAYSQGTPVVGANRGGIPELIVEGETGFVFEAGNIDSLLDGIKKMEEQNDSSYQHIRAKCLSRLKQEYTEMAYYERFMKCVKEII
jgi:glycosyltransferase involved in cell wall biosynthesis